MEQKIVRPNGSEYMTVALVGDMVEFRNFGDRGYVIRFDTQVLDQLIPFLTEVNFWRKLNETHD